MTRKEVGQNKTSLGKKILIISEDLKSFPSYLELIFSEFRIAPKNNKPLSKKREKIFIKARAGEQNFVNIRHVGTNSLTIVKNGNLESKNFDKVYCVFDKNLNDDSYKQVLNYSVKSNVKLINSVPSYEFWLLLHFKKSDAEFLNNQKLIKELERLIRKETGNKKFKYPKSEFPKEISSFVIEKLPDAIRNAKAIEKLNKQNGCTEPCTKIFQLIEDFCHL
jgi:hypothetical protein